MLIKLIWVWMHMFTASPFICCSIILCVAEQLGMHVNDSEVYPKVYQSWVNSLINFAIISVCILEGIFIMLENWHSKISPNLLSFPPLPPSPPLVMVDCHFRIGSRQTIDLASLYAAALRCIFCLFNMALLHVMFQTVTLGNEVLYIC